MLKLNAYQLKWIAILAMFSFHLSYALRDIMPVWLLIPMQIVGGLTFPIMAYFVVEGYRHTSNLKRYILRLFIFGAISIPLYILTVNVAFLNIMFAIIFSLLILAMYDRIRIKPLFWLIFIVICLPLSMLLDWIIMGPITVLLYHVIKNETARRIIPSIVAGGMWTLLGLNSFLGLRHMYYLQDMHGYNMQEGIDMIYAMTGNAHTVFALMFFGLSCVVAGILILNFNGERGKPMKWLFYSFYPLHLAIILVIMILFGIADFSAFGF